MLVIFYLHLGQDLVEPSATNGKDMSKLAGSEKLDSMSL